MVHVIVTELSTPFSKNLAHPLRHLITCDKIPTPLQNSPLKLNKAHIEIRNTCDATE
jgi:hypothetical protein